jgi:hypothetical protein
MKRVEVVWYDAYDMSSWMSRVEMARFFPSDHKGKLQRSRGWLYTEDENKVVIAMTWSSEVDRDDEESLAGVLAIPKGWVVEVIDQDG